jgi:hypothetical protein
VAGLVLTAPARAFADSDLTFELDVPVEDQPHHVCVVSRGGHKDTSVPLSTLATLRAPELADGTAPDSLENEGAGDTWRFAASQLVGAVAPHGVLEDRSSIAGALGALGADASQTPDCDGGGGTCMPGFAIAPDLTVEGGLENLHIACAANLRAKRQSSARDSATLVAVLFLNRHKQVMSPISGVSLDGNVASVTLVGSIRGDAVFVASVLGGHYAPGGTATSVGGRIVLPLIPRCQLYDVELPFSDPRSESELAVELRETGKPKALLTCRGAVVDGFIRVRLPHRPTHAQRILEISGERGGNPDRVALRYITTWSDRTPPRPLRAALRSVSFSWTRHCLYPPRERCPRAILSDSGTECDDRVAGDGTCEYVCDARARNVPIRLPEAVTFKRRDRLDEWSGRLSYSGQTLDGYVPPIQQSIDVRVPNVPRSGAPVHVQMTLTKGHQEAFPFSPGKLNVRVPDTLCTDEAAFRYTGPSRYRVRKYPVAGGEIQLEPPDAVASPADLRLVIGIGHEFMTFGSDAVEPGFGKGLYWRVGVASAFPRIVKHVFLEASSEFLIGSREYFVSDAAGTVSERSAGVMRFLLGTGVGYQSGRHAVVGGISGGFTDGIGAHRDFIPMRGIVSPTLRWRIFIAGKSSVTSSLRLFVREQTGMFDLHDTLASNRDRSLAGFDVAWDYSM